MTGRDAIALLEFGEPSSPEYADALKLAIEALKAQEPRVMTEEEMRDAEAGTVIFCERRDEVWTYVTPMIKYDDGVFESRFLSAEPEVAHLPNTRFWTARPDEETRRTTPWEQAL